MSKQVIDKQSEKLDLLKVLKKFNINEYAFYEKLKQKNSTH